MDYIFFCEKKDYEVEGIEWRDIVYYSNDDVLEFVFKVSYFVLWYNYVLGIIEYVLFLNVENFCNRKNGLCFYCFRGMVFFCCWMRSFIFYSLMIFFWFKNLINIVRIVFDML